MTYYTKDGRLVNYDHNDSSVVSLNHGKQGSVYKVEDTVCLKLYSDDNRTKGIFDDCDTKFNQEMFEYFKNNFSGSSMCELYDLLYDERVITVVGYTMKYYKEMIENILNLPIDYVLDNFSLIYDLVMKLTADCIRVVDMQSSNIINTKNGMIVIDYDKYRFDNDSSKEVLDYINRSALIFAFCGIFKNSLKKMGIDVDNNIELKNRISSLFTIETTPLVLKYKLRSYKTPIDYIINHK